MKVIAVQQVDDDFDKKIPTVSTPDKQDATQHDTAILPNMGQGGVDASGHQDNGTGKDGLGQPWIPGLFNPLDMLSPSQSAIMFSPQPPSQDVTPMHISEVEEDVQYNILIGSLDDLLDDPWDIVLFLMDEAMGNI